MEKDKMNGAAADSRQDDLSTNGSPSSVDFSEEWVPVGGTYTYVVRCGKLRPNQPLILIIPGNPGVADYYREFMKVIHEKSEKQMALWCVSHAGHVTIPTGVPKAMDQSCKYLDGQIAHKMKFVQDFVPEDNPVILIGHSIGCYMILKMMDVLDSKRVIRSSLLFPTIERMAESPKGRTFTKMSTVLGAVGHLPVYPLYYLMPNSLRYYLTKLYFMNKVPETALQGTVRLVNPDCVANAISMAKTEMEQVKDLDHDMIKRHLDKLMFYYGADDHWCPLEYAHDMRAAHPSADLRICDRGFEHAFCLKNSIGMAEVLWDWFKDKLPHIFTTNRI